MEKPKIVAKQPVALNLEPGTYFWCACGKSSNQPFCDGSHKESGLTPVQFKIDEKKTAYLCQCKQTGNEPYCDGTHRNL